LLLVAAEGLDLINIGDLERQHGEHGDAKDGGEVIPCEAVTPYQVEHIRNETDGDDQRHFDHTDYIGKHDRRISRVVGLVGECKGSRRKLVGRHSPHAGTPPGRHRDVENTAGSDLNISAALSVPAPGQQAI
jgi:hypothetical protein